MSRSTSSACTVRTAESWRPLPRSTTIGMPSCAASSVASRNIRICSGVTTGPLEHVAAVDHDVDLSVARDLHDLVEHDALVSELDCADADLRVSEAKDPRQKRAMRPVEACRSV